MDKKEEWIGLWLTRDGSTIEVTKVNLHYWDLKGDHTNSPDLDLMRRLENI